MKGRGRVKPRSDNQVFLDIISLTRSLAQWLVMPDFENGDLSRKTWPCLWGFRRPGREGISEGGCRRQKVGKKWKRGGREARNERTEEGRKEMKEERREQKIRKREGGKKQRVDRTESGREERVG